jgi:hypothetical protein
VEDFSYFFKGGFLFLGGLLFGASKKVVFL